MEPNNERISSKVFAAVIATGLMSFSGVLVETSMNIAFPTLMRDFNVSTKFFAVLPNQMNNIFILIVYIIYMAGMGMILGDVMTDTLAVIDESETTQGNAILNTAQQFAGAVGTSITSAIVASSQKGTKSADLTRIGTQHAYIFLLCLVILIMALFIKYVGRRTATK